ncbi:hypothetical protein Ahy_B03g067410 isoform B [Arachis hypogaea]|uniref:Major facilitator superfamily (MFS) profile domain-containing protein n=1 Tax=Arachis hypogaea TaxID=3818 RepID=A0A445A712_ARAHY|nr:hypothetical protein Ahy_B03g067410 isoform B [Arachis hypogaea]
MARDQLQMLNALDAAKTQFYHFTAIILFGRIYYHVDGALKPGTLPPNISAAVNGVAFIGTLSGQLFFGWLGDKLRQKESRRPQSKSP